MGGEGEVATCRNSISALLVIFRLVIGNVTSVILIVLGVVNLQFQSPFASIFLRPILRIDKSCPLPLRRKAMINLDSILKSRDITLPTVVCIISYGFSSSHVWM